MEVNGQWFIEFYIDVKGRGSFGDTAEFGDTATIPLFASNQKDIKKQAIIAEEQLIEAAKYSRLKIFMPHCRSLEQGDKITLNNFRTYFEAY